MADTAVPNRLPNRSSPSCKRSKSIRRRSLEAGGWRTAECGVAVARVPMPERNNHP